MKVLAISSYGLLGGGELTFSVFCEHRPPDAEVDVLLVSDGPLRERLEAQGLSVRATEGCVGRPTLRMLWAFDRQLIRVLREERYDVVWALGQKATLLAAAACRRRRVPLVWHKIDFSADALLAKPLALASSAVIGVSNAVLDALGPLRRRRPVTIVGPPVRLPREVRPAFDPDQLAIGTLARLVPYKGQHLLIEAAARLRTEFEGLRLILAGGPVEKFPAYQDELEDLAQRRGLADAVEFPGFVEATGVLESLTVFVNATHRDEEGFGFEGLSGAMLEASAAGLPVVATRGGGTAEGIVAGETGTVVEHPEAAELAAAIRPYLADPELARRTGAAGREFVSSRFAPEVVSAQLWDAIAQAGGPASSS